MRTIDDKSKIALVLHKIGIRYESCYYRGQKIYFLRNLITKDVKIGISFNPLMRLRTLSSLTHYPLTREIAISGYNRLERRLHKKFRKSLIKHEWFRSTPELENLIRELKLIA
jgi:hypothetical protein